MKKLRDIFCAVFRHSLIATNCLGYQYCGRCGAQLGDGLAGIARSDLVSLKHRVMGGWRYKDGTLAENCPCATTKLSWIDWALLPKSTRENS